MTRIYISGPITGRKDLNRNAFMVAYNRLTLYFSRMTVINPHSVEPKVNTWRGFMTADIIELLECDTILMLKGWRWSKGARLEYRIARDFGMTIVYYATSPELFMKRFIKAKGAS